MQRLQTSVHQGIRWEGSKRWSIHHMWDCNQHQPGQPSKKLTPPIANPAQSQPSWTQQKASLQKPTQPKANQAAWPKASQPGPMPTRTNANQDQCQCQPGPILTRTNANQDQCQSGPMPIRSNATQPKSNLVQSQCNQSKPTRTTARQDKIKFMPTQPNVNLATRPKANQQLKKANQAACVKATVHTTGSTEHHIQ